MLKLTSADEFGIELLVDGTNSFINEEADLRKVMWFAQDFLFKWALYLSTAPLVTREHTRLAFFLLPRSREKKL